MSEDPDAGSNHKEAKKHANEEVSEAWLDLDSVHQADDLQPPEFIKEQGAYADSSYARVRSRAQKGDVEAQFELCMRYHDGRGGVEQDNEASYRWCYEAAKQGHAWALANLGWMYESGAGVGKDEAKAAEAYHAAAKKGLPDAMVWFGQMLEQGRGVDEDLSAAFEWYSRAAERGNASGQYNVALCLQFGKGVDQDENQAFTWYEKAGDQQHVEALYNLGWLYSQGRGVVKNADKAKELFNIAAGHDGGAADELIIEAMDYEQGRGGVNKDAVKSHHLYLKAANKGSSNAMFTVGVNYEYGRGTEKSWKNAHLWYKKAASKGHPEANFRYRFRQLLAAGEVIRFFRYSGVVDVSGVGIESRRNESGVVGQFGGANSGGRRAKRIRGTKFYLNTDLGERVEVDLPHRPESLLSQQHITLIYAIKKGKSTGPYMLLVNHDIALEQTLTPSRTFWDEEVGGNHLLIGFGLLLIAIGVPYFVGSVLHGVNNSSDDVNLFFHPFNWALFIPLLALLLFWMKSVLVRRKQGIQLVRQRMVDIKNWISQSTINK